MFLILHKFVWKILNVHVSIFVETLCNFPQILKGICDENKIKNHHKIFYFVDDITVLKDGKPRVLPF